MSNCGGWTLPFCDTRTRVAVVSGGQTTACWLRLQPTSAEASRARGRIRAVSTERIYGKGRRRSKQQRRELVDQQTGFGFRRRLVPFETKAGGNPCQPRVSG